MKKLIVTLTDEQYERLLRLAEKRKRTPVQCVQDFVQWCQPEGSGWKHPGEK